MARPRICTIVSCAETLTPCWIGLFDTHVGITKVDFDHVAFGILYIYFELFNVTLHGLAKFDFTALVFSFV